MTDHDPMPDAGRTARVAARNDAFRRTAVRGVFFTATLAAEGPVTMAEILARVRAYGAFTPDNDPEPARAKAGGEHDFGSFTHVLSLGGAPREETILWKIDVYADASLTYGAEDPLAPEAVRILTIMHSSDY